MNPFCRNPLRWGGILIAAFMACRLPAFASPASDSPPESVKYLSSFSGTGRLQFFANQQDELQHERYITEGSMTLDFNFVSFKDKLSLRTRFTLLADMGTSVAENLPFSPKETAYEITPYVEYQQESHLVRFGWNHVCQHLIYKNNAEPWYTLEGSNLPPDVYYNRLFIGVGRREIRPEIMRQTFFQEEPRSALPRILWYLEAGGYIRSLLDMEQDSLTGGNDWTADLTAEIHLLLHAGDRWLLFANSRTQELLDVDQKIFSRELLQLEAAFDTRGFGLSLLLWVYVLDEHPRDSREGIVEIGAMSYF